MDTRKGNGLNIPAHNILTDDVEKLEPNNGMPDTAPSGDPETAKIASELAGASYSSMSRLKQQRALKAVNKKLKEANLKPMTHMDMLKTTEWSSLKETHMELSKSLLTTFNGLKEVLESESLPDSVKESDNLKKLKESYVTTLGYLSDRLLENRSKFWSEEEGYRKGSVTDISIDLFTNIQQEYLDIRNEMLKYMISLDEPISVLLSLIKVHLTEMTRQALLDDNTQEVESA